MVDFPNNQRAVRMSLATFKGHLHNYGLSRCGLEIGVDKLREISGSGELQGFRTVGHSLRFRSHIHVPRERIAHTLCELNPAGTRERTCRMLARWGFTSYVPNFSWHADGMVSVLLFNCIKSQCRNISRISNQFRKIEFWFIPPKQPFGMVISKNDIKKSPSALQLKNFRKVRKFTKNTIFIHEISLNFERFQRNSTGAKKLLLTSSSSHS